ncbi:MAG: YfiT family bacillithiol transferase, partial [Sphingomonadales bacterium]
EMLEYVLQIQVLPNELSKLLNRISAESTENTYRPGGWNVRQIIHHLADAHLNAWVRTKLTLTEENPTVKPWNENAWAEGKDYGFAYEASFLMLVGIHQRWSLLLLETLKTPELLLRNFFHPEHNKSFTLAQLIAMYAWHGNTHLGHIRIALGK